MPTTKMDEPAQETDGTRLELLLKDALSGLHFQLWGSFAPFLMATWRFIFERRPGTFDQLDVTVADPLVVRGRGAIWFCDTLVEEPEFLDRAERIMYGLVAKIPEQAKRRGSLLWEEVPAFENIEMSETAAIVLALVDRARASGAL